MNKFTFFASSHLNRCIINFSVLDRVSDVPCPEGLVYSECSTKMDDFCYGGLGNFTFGVMQIKS